MAEIYLCSAHGPEGFRKDVVLKRVRPALGDDPSFLQMFVAEAKVASRLNHANLVQIYDFDRHEDAYYLAMEYVRGRSLWEVRRRAKELMRPMPPPLVAHVGREVSRGLACAHQATAHGQPLGLVHRDVSPQNVLLSVDGAVKLTDFGIAKAGDKLTAPGVLKGKFAYMSPEQARGESVDARTDLFALGIVLWELLTGGRLFEGDSDLAILKAVRESAIAPPRRLNPLVSEALDAVVMRALERDPARRFQTAHEVEQALTGYLLGAPKHPEHLDLAGYLRQLFPEDALPEPSQVVDAPEPAGEGVASPVPAAPLPLPELVPGEAFLDTARPLANATRPDRPSDGGEVHSGVERAHTLLTRRPRTDPSPLPGGGADRPLPGRFSLTVGMRRALVIAAGTTVALAVTALGVSLGASRGGGAVSAAAPGPRPGAGGLPAPAGPPPELALAPGRSAPGTNLQAPAAATAEEAAVASAPPPVVDAPGDGVGGSAAAPSERPVAPGQHPGAASKPAERHRASAGTRGAGALGVLTLKVMPWAHVTLNGRDVGEVAGRRRYTLTPGRYRVKLEHPHGRRELVVQVEAGSEVVRELDLSAPRPSL